MQDALLSTTKYLPAAGATNTTDVIDLSTYLSANTGEDVRRLGFFRVAIPAMPENSDSSKTILIDLQDATNLVPGTFANTTPRTVIEIPGVSSSGSLALTVDVPLPPGLRGPVKFLNTVPSGAGTNTGIQISYTWTWL